MYIVTRRYETASPQFPEAGIRQIKEGLVPLLSKVQGFVSYDAFQAGDGVVASVSAFETRSGAEESARQAAEWVKQNLAAMLPKAPQVTAGEVLVHESRQPAAVR